jgi:hypothetical protein
MEPERLNERQFRLKSGAQGAMDMTIDGEVEVLVTEGRFASEFNLVVPRPVIEWRRVGPLPLSVTTRLVRTGR